MVDDIAIADPNGRGILEADVLTDHNAGANPHTATAYNGADITAVDKQAAFQAT